MILENLFYDNNSISEYDGGKLVSVLNTIDQINEVSNLDSFIVVRFDDYCELYNYDYSLANSIPIGQNIEIDLQDSIFYFVETVMDSVNIVSMDWNGNKNVLYEYPIGNEFNHAIDYVDENKFLITGTELYDKRSGLNAIANAFFRCIDVSGDNFFSNTYLSLTNYKIDQVEKDSFLSVVTMDGDSIFRHIYICDISFTLTNLGFERISYANIYNKAFVNNFGPDKLDFYTLSESLHALDEFSYSNRINFIADIERIKNIELVVPGANYRFNNDEYLYILPEFTSDVTTLEFNLEF